MCFFKWQVGQRAIKRDNIEHKDGSSEKGNRNVFFVVENINKLK
jgi:hypothetical protein